MVCVLFLIGCSTTVLQETLDKSGCPAAVVHVVVTSTFDWRSIRCTRTGSCPFSIRGKPVPQVVEPKARTILCNHSGGRGGSSNALQSCTIMLPSRVACLGA